MNAVACRKKRWSPTCRWVRLALLVVITLCAYAGSLGNDFVNYDDNVYLTENQHVRSGFTLQGVVWAFSTTERGNWHPLTWISHLLDVQFFGLDPRGHHAISLLLHLANSILLFLVLEAATGASWASWLAAALFAVHPLHVESVAWAAERKDVLSGFFWMACLGLYARYARQPGRRRYAILAATFALGLLAKPMLVTLPLALLLLDFWPLGRLGAIRDVTADQPVARAPLSRLLWEKAPLLVLSAAASVISYLAQRGRGAVTGFDQLAAADRAANALVAYASYILKMLWPARLAFFYPYPAAGLPLWQTAIAAVCLLTVSAAVFAAGRNRGYLVTGWLWYLSTLLPVIGIVQVGAQSMADRYTYLPSIGLFVAAAWGLRDLARARNPGKLALGAAAAMALGLLVAVTRVQTGYWRDSTTLFRHAIAVTAGNYVAHNALGTVLAAHGDPGGAIEQFRLAVRERPADPEALTNLGVAFARSGRADLAKPLYARAIASRPGFVRAHYNLGVLLQKEGRMQEALAEYSLALVIEPGHAEAHNNLGVVLRTLGRREEAILHFRQALESKPGFELAADNLRARN